MIIRKYSCPCHLLGEETVIFDTVICHTATEILCTNNSLNQWAKQSTKTHSKNGQQISSMHVLTAYLEPICELKVTVTGYNNWLSVDMSDNTATITLFCNVWQINWVPCTVGVPTVTLTCPRLHSNLLCIDTCAVYREHNLNTSTSTNLPIGLPVSILRDRYRVNARP